MPKASIHSVGLVRPRSSAPMLDKFGIVAISACVFAAIGSPLLIYFLHPPPYTIESIMVPSTENRIFWPAIFTISIILAVRDRSRFARLAWPPHIICLLAYLAFAGASVVWAFKPEFSFTRYLQQVMVVTSIVLPALLADRTAD